MALPEVQGNNLRFTDQLLKTQERWSEKKKNQDAQRQSRLFDPETGSRKVRKGGEKSIMDAINSGEISAGAIYLFKEAVLRFSSLLINANLACGDPRQNVTIKIPDPEGGEDLKDLTISQTAFGELVAAVGDAENLSDAIGSVLGCQVSRVLADPVWRGSFGSVAEEITTLLSVDPADVDPEVPITFMQEYVAKSDLEGFIFVFRDTAYVVPKSEFDAEIRGGRLTLPGITQGSRKIFYKP